MVISPNPPFDLEDVTGASRTFEEAIVYADMEGETVLHEGVVRLLGNGWVELPTGRLLSPDAVHHIDRQMD